MRGVSMFGFWFLFLGGGGGGRCLGALATQVRLSRGLTFLLVELECRWMRSGASVGCSWGGDKARLGGEPLGYLWVVVVTMRMIDSLRPLSWFSPFFLLSVLYAWMLLREIFISCLSSLRYARAASGRFFSRISVRLQATGRKE
ncbi:hypothetical protein B0H14DRAFT_2976708 [Mycena olivaceomarginata]|nr:hypothetical protein B0H14DRAFT_2976708 [Mycena olivaceomarginata]